MQLREWQERLEAHFEKLATARSKSGDRLFALEHGLSVEEVTEIGGHLREALRLDRHLGNHWLVWVIYSTEFGYSYYGDEYWPSFEERTPYWKQRGDRNKIRLWFQKFHEEYNGVVPSGPWAEYFTIIAWPITHAILPRYLQGQFAKALYDSRYSLARLDSLSASAIGHLLATQTWDVSSRFNEFLQQEELAGRIVLALLSDRTVADGEYLSDATLRRLVNDLERVRNAREWLKDTRRYVADRFKGAGSIPTIKSPSVAVKPSEQTGSAAPLSIKPRLLLRSSGARKWSLVADFPSLSAVGNINPQLRTFIKRTRCKVVGSDGAWLPGGWLSLDSQQRALKSWPAANMPLLEFERQNAQLDNILKAETVVKTDKPLLFRVGADGIARETLTRIVRPGGHYVLLNATVFATQMSGFTACAVDCTGAHAVELVVPNLMSTENFNTHLQSLCLQIARTVRVWPAGTGARDWDGEGRSEWLTTEIPCFGITNDFPLESYSIRINDGQEVILKAGDAGKSVFLRTPHLSAGVHTLSVKPKPARAAQLPFSPLTEGIVRLHVREPLPWTPGTTSHNGLAVSLEPSNPTLDQFWEGRVGLTILGPPSQRATCIVSLANARGDKLLEKEIATLSLPVTAADWKRTYWNFIKDERRSWLFTEASNGCLTVTAGELGLFKLRLERVLKPLRWACRRSQSTTTVRLIDDTGTEQSATTSFYSFQKPSVRQAVETASLLNGKDVTAPGGLYLAQTRELTQAMIVSAPQRTSGFRELLVEPTLRHFDVRTEDMFDLLSLWNSARLTGPLVGLQRDRIVARLLNCLYAQLCGQRWATLEYAFIDHPEKRDDTLILELQRAIGASGGFSAALRLNFDQMKGEMKRAMAWYADVAFRYQVSSDKDLCELAIRLAGNPQALNLRSFDFRKRFEQIKKDAAVLRGARFLALLSLNKSAQNSGRSLPEWKWS